MSDNGPDQQFLDLADSFIALANSHCDTVSPTRVSSTMLFAAARFNAFVIASSVDSKDELTSDLEPALKYFLAQYEKMLGENLADYVENYDQYIGDKLA